MNVIETTEELREIYGSPSEAALKKVTHKITGKYRAWIEQSSFCIISSVGLQGTDASPRGDDGEVVKIVDEKTMALPDWEGNQRIDTLQNIIEDGRVSLLFMVSGSNNVIRVNGNAKITADDKIKAQFVKKNRQPKVVILIDVAEVYFQCARALMRSKLWERGNCSAGLPTPGEMLKEANEGSFDAESYDRSWPERYKTSLW